MRNTLLPDFALALPGLLHGYLAQAVESVFEATADSPLACEFAEWLIMKEICHAQSYSTLERYRVMKIGNLCKGWLASGFANPDMAVWKVKFVYSVASSISCCDPAGFRQMLTNARFCLIMLREQCCQTIMEAKDAA